MSLIVFDVDTQIDFMKKEGNAYIDGAEYSIDNINAIITHALRNQVAVAGTTVFHQGDAEFAVFETEGIDKISETRLVDDEFFYNVPITRHGIDIPVASSCWQIYFEKAGNNIWHEETGQPDNVMSYLRAENVRDVVIVGANYDGAVEHAIYGFLKNAYNVTVVTDAIAGYNNDLDKIPSVDYITTAQFLKG